MKIIYREHLKRRIKERAFPKNYPRKIYTQAMMHFYDTKTNHYIAVSQLFYIEEVRKLVISYDIISSRVEIVTIFPISEKDLQSKILSGRWVIKN